jgi:DNA-binding phage protein
MELNMEYIKAQLQRRTAERQLSVIARGCGLTVRTLQRLAKGQSGTIKNAQTVQDYLLRNEGKKRLDDEQKG